MKNQYRIIAIVVSFFFFEETSFSEGPPDADRVVLNGKIVLVGRGHGRPLRLEPIYSPAKIDAEGKRFSIDEEVKLFTHSGYRRLPRLEFVYTPPGCRDERVSLESYDDARECWSIIDYKKLIEKHDLTAEEKYRRLNVLYPESMPHSDKTELLYVFLNGALEYESICKPPVHEVLSDGSVRLLTPEVRFRFPLDNANLFAKSGSRKFLLSGEVCILSRTLSAVVPSVVLTRVEGTDTDTIRFDPSGIPTLVAVAADQNLVPAFLSRYYSRLSITREDLSNPFSKIPEWKHLTILDPLIPIKE